MRSGQGAADTTATKRKNGLREMRDAPAHKLRAETVYQETTPGQEGFELYRSRMLSAIERKN